MSRRRRRFTLMEILLVLAILVVLGSMVGVGYVKIQQECHARSSARTQISLLEDAVKTYMHRRRRAAVEPRSV